jgi:hypothetical protein
MALQPGEAAVLIIRRNESQPEKYFFAVRTSMTSSFNQSTHDFQIGSFQVPVTELGERSDVQSALDAAVAIITNRVAE